MSYSGLLIGVSHGLPAGSRRRRWFPLAGATMAEAGKMPALRMAEAHHVPIMYRSYIGEEGGCLTLYDGGFYTRRDATRADSPWRGSGTRSSP